jgi:hypothetical protein
MSDNFDLGISDFPEPDIEPEISETKSSSSEKYNLDISDFPEPDLEPQNPETPLPNIEFTKPRDISDFLKDGIDVGDVNFSISKDGLCFEIDEKDIGCLKPFVHGKCIGGKFVFRF